MRRAVYAAGAGACAAGAARLAYSVLNRRPPGGQKAWSRTNHRGEPVTLLEGPAVAAGQTVAMQALAVELAGGKASSYGFTANGATAIAPSPAPTPSASASATPTSSTKKKAST